MSNVITAPGFTRRIGRAIIPGGAAGDHTVPGPIGVGDTIISVRHLTNDLVTNAEIGSEFTITSANTVNNALGTVTTGAFLLVIWAEAL